MTLDQVTQRKLWIFDMDGTLSEAQHDFDAIRCTLGLPDDLPILESIAALPPEQAKAVNEQLDEIELEISKASKPAEGAAELLEALIANDCKIGILTRNNLVNIQVTLDAAGLYQYFDEVDLISRDCIAPKPAPDGIFHLVDRWQGDISDAIMIGDSIHDIAAGNNAGVTSVYYDPDGVFEHRKQADICVRSLRELIPSG
ncbi:HAD family hydrolase [Leucothrix arctica]|uniref:HAD family hydrolase n=1 Tax=Leucothrix arctica TaxID=1481894 RepID=A0A317CCQ8_9GAMM|nr:HAD family hydrolase [Leucothrix arctica]PWQ96169.1 HAD family hydrolase [Leucothrix arctica]